MRTWETDPCITDPISRAATCRASSPRVDAAAGDVPAASRKVHVGQQQVAAGVGDQAEGRGGQRWRRGHVREDQLHQVRHRDPGSGAGDDDCRRHRRYRRAADLHTRRPAATGTESGEQHRHTGRLEAHRLGNNDRETLLNPGRAPEMRLAHGDRTEGLDGELA